MLLPKCAAAGADLRVGDRISASAALTGSGRYRQGSFEAGESCAGDRRAVDPEDGRRQALPTKSP